MILNFEHNQSAHCENGVISNLLNFHGLKVSEPMVFGIGSGLFFAYIPFVKLNNLPATSFRPVPGVIFKRFTKKLGIKMYRRKFSDYKESMDELDKYLNQGIPVGLQVGAYHLSYFPRPYRFHFNMHNIVVFGKEEGKYLISDPVMEGPTELSYDELLRVRYARGAFAPNGQMYFPIEIPRNIDFQSAIKKGLKKTAKDMLKIPIPLFGVKGIRFLARQIRKWPKKLGDKTASLYLSQVVRMQEEIGTGGAGFRFMFGAFLQEARKYWNHPDLFDISKEVTAAGDRWRDFAVMAGRIAKNRASASENYDAASEILLNAADREEKIFKRILGVVG